MPTGHPAWAQHLLNDTAAALWVPGHRAGAEQNQMLGPKTGWPGSPQQNVGCLPGPQEADSLMLGRPRAGWLGGSTTAGWLGEAAGLETVLGGRWMGREWGGVR